MARVVAVLIVMFSMATAPGGAQSMPDVRCQVEDYAVHALVYGWVNDAPRQTQVVVLRDPAGEQEARFDLTRGAALIALRYRGKEVLWAESPGASVSLFLPRRGTEEELKGLPPEWSAYQPSQAGTSQRVPATTGGVGCNGQSTMRAFTMMIDQGVNSSFQREPLVAVWKGEISNTFTPGYSTPITIETSASWIENPGKTPRYYLRLDQSVMSVRPENLGPADWLLTASVPWRFETKTGQPECTEERPCTSASAPVVANGRYEDAARTVGFATVVPTAAWNSGKIVSRPSDHGFSTVLSRPLEGLKAFRFTWYACPGDWEQTRAFAARVTR